MLPKARLSGITLEGDKQFEQQANNLNYDWILGILRVMAETPETRAILKEILSDILKDGE